MRREKGAVLWWIIIFRAFLIFHDVSEEVLDIQLYV